MIINHDTPCIIEGIAGFKDACTTPTGRPRLQNREVESHSSAETFGGMGEITRITRGARPALAEFSEHVIIQPVVATNGAAMTADGAATTPIAGEIVRPQNPRGSCRGRV